jgi:iron complex outermembrane receptor protein
VDLVTTYLFHVGAGTLATTLAYNSNKTDVTSHDPTVINNARIIDIQHYAPNNRANLNLDYHIGRFIGSLHENYYGTFRDENDYPGQLFSAKFTTDLDLSYEVWKNVTAAIGGRNITNAYPDKLASTPKLTIYPTTGGAVDGEVYPRTGGPFGFNGAFYYARVAVKF